MRGLVSSPTGNPDLDSVLAGADEAIAQDVVDGILTATVDGTSTTTHSPMERLRVKRQIEADAAGKKGRNLIYSRFRPPGASS